MSLFKKFIFINFNKTTFGFVSWNGTDWNLKKCRRWDIRSYESTGNMSSKQVRVQSSYNLRCQWAAASPAAGAPGVWASPAASPRCCSDGTAPPDRAPWPGTAGRWSLNIIYKTLCVIIVSVLYYIHQIYWSMLICLCDEVEKNI